MAAAVQRDVPKCAHHRDGRLEPWDCRMEGSAIGRFRNWKAPQDPATVCRPALKIFKIDFNRFLGFNPPYPPLTPLTPRGYPPPG